MAWDSRWPRDHNLEELLKHLSAVFVLAFVSLTSASAQFTLETAAGGGPNHIPGLGANSNLPAHMTYANGSLYIADQGENRVFKVDSTGTITVVAGSGFADIRGGVPNGDGGLAINATLVNPSAVAVDSSGTMYIADYYGIRKVDTGGIITTIPGVCGSPGNMALPVALNPTGTALYCVQQYTSSNVYSVVYRIDLSTYAVTTFAGGGTLIANDGLPPTAAALGQIQGLTVDGAGDVFIADFGYSSIPALIYKVSGGLITHVAGGGSGYIDGSPATSVNLPRPLDVALDSANNIFLSTNVGLVYRIDAATQLITRFAGGGSCPTQPFINDGGPALSACMNPVGVTLDPSNNVYVSNPNYHLVHQILPAPPNDIRVFVGNLIPAGIGANAGPLAGGYQYFSGDGYAATDARIGPNPNGLAVDPSGNLFIGDLANAAVRRVDATTGIITTVTPLPNPGGNPHTGVVAYYLAAGPDGTVYVNDSQRYVESIVGNTNTLITSGGGTYSPDGTPALTGSVGTPQGIAVDGGGNLYVADNTFCTVRKISGGILGTVAGIHGTCAVGGDGGPAAAATLGYPTNLVSDAAGNLWVYDSGRIRKISADGTSITTVMSGLSAGLAVDAYDNVLTSFNGPPYCPAGECVVQISGSDGSITPIAGGGVENNLGVFSPDGVAALGAVLTGGINGIAANAKGQVFFLQSNGGLDPLGSRASLVRRLDPVNASTATSASSTAVTFSSINSQPVALAAIVTSGVAVNAGPVAFTVTGVAGPVTSGAVVAGSASAVLTVPAGTPAGIYSIQASYSGASGLAPSSDTTATLTINPILPSILSVILSPATVVGGVMTTANTIHMNGPAPLGGAVVQLTSSDAGVVPPLSVTVVAGARPSPQHSRSPRPT